MSVFIWRENSVSLQNSSNEAKSYAVYQYSYQRTIGNLLINCNPVVETQPFVTRLIYVQMNILLLFTKLCVYDKHLTMV